MLLKNIAYLNENFDIAFGYDIRIEGNIIKEIGKNLRILEKNMQVQRKNQ